MSKDIIIERASLGNYKYPHISLGGFDRVTGQLLAFGGLTWVNGHCFIAYDTPNGPQGHANLLVREAKKMLARAAQAGSHEVLAISDPVYAKTSARLLQHLGFKPSGEMLPEGEIWVWNDPDVIVATNVVEEVV